MGSPEELRKPLQENALENRERPLEGKVALVTGSSRDIGGEIAIRLVEDGCEVVGSYREKHERAEKIRIAIEQIQGYIVAPKEKIGEIHFVQGDIRDPKIREELKDTLDKLGRKLDFLILNSAGTKETVRQVSVTANNALVDMFLPNMEKGGKIIFMQSVPGHFYPKLLGLNKMPDFYDLVAKAKYDGEQLLLSRIPEFEEKGISFLVVCPPTVSDTANIRMFDRESKRKYGVTATEKHAEISDMFGVPRSVEIKDVGQKVIELLKRKDLPQGYVERFCNV